MVFTFLYHDVPQCPRCGSMHTGRYIYAPISDLWIARWGLRRGEYILFRSYPGGNNCFCGECGVEWKADIPLKLISFATMQEKKQKRGIYDAKEYFSEYEKNMKQQKINEDKAKKKEKKKNKLSHRAARKIGEYVKDTMPFRRKSSTETNSDTNREENKWKS